MCFSDSINVTEIGTTYESCEKNREVPAAVIRTNWQNLKVSIGSLAPGQIFYGAVQLFDVPENIDINYLRIGFNDLSRDSVEVRLRQVHTTTAVQTASSFFTMTKAQRQVFYKDWLPGSELHDADITYPKEGTVKECSYDYNCAYILEKPSLSDKTDVLPIFLFTVENKQTKALEANVVVGAYAGDSQPGCRIAPVGIVLGSLWTVAVVIIIAVVVGLLILEKIKLKKDGLLV